MNHSLIILDLRKNSNSSGFDSGEEKVVFSERVEAVASLKEEKLVFTGRAEPGVLEFLGELSLFIFKLIIAYSPPSINLAPKALKSAKRLPSTIKISTPQ